MIKQKREKERERNERRKFKKGKFSYLKSHTQRPRTE